MLKKDPPENPLLNGSEYNRLFDDTKSTKNTSILSSKECIIKTPSFRVHCDKKTDSVSVQNVQENTEV